MNKQEYTDQLVEARRSAAQNLTTDSLRNLAKALHSAGYRAARQEPNYFQAIEFYEEAVSIYNQIGDDAGRSSTYFDLGVAYEVGFHDNELAYRYIKKALDLLQNERLRSHYERELS
jgi:tetratricopeptide (TPR) repeat protein